MMESMKTTKLIATTDVMIKDIVLLTKNSVLGMDNDYDYDNSTISY